MQSYSHFTLSERECLADLIKAGRSLNQIAMILQRNKSSISRELRRNSTPDGHYRPLYATTNYLHARKKSVKKPRLDDARLKDFASVKLQEFWSPETIVARWKMENPQDKLSHSTIYSAIKNSNFTNISVKTHLRRRGKRQTKAEKVKCQTIKPVHTIHDRPPEIENRL